MKRITLTDTKKTALRILDSGNVDKSQFASFSGAVTVVAWGVTLSILTKF